MAKKHGGARPGAGRKPKYTDAIAEEVLQGIAEGQTLLRICQREGMPDRTAILNWVREDREGRAPKYRQGFAARYDSAVQLRCEVWAEEVIDVADDGSNDWMEREGKTQVNGEAIARSRLRVDTRKFMLSKLLPRIYGDKQTVEHTGSVALTRLSDDELERRIGEKMAALGMQAPEAIAHDADGSGDGSSE